MQLHEASFAVMDWMLHIAATEGRMPNIGVHSIAGCGQGQRRCGLNLMILTRTKAWASWPAM